MSGWFKAIAVDFDGTLAEGDRPPDDDVLAAVGESRRAGRRVVLVTGRILEELRAVFPAVDDWFDAIVAENGAVLAVEGSARILAAPVEMELDGALVARGVPFRRGQVLLATRADHEVEIGEELRRLGLEAQLTRNRGELMVLPPGVTKDPAPTARSRSSVCRITAPSGSATARTTTRCCGPASSAWPWRTRCRP